MTTAPRSNPSAAPTLDRVARTEFLTVAEIADRLRVSKMTIHRAIDAGEFPGAIRVGRSIRVPQAAYEAYVAGSVITSTDALALAPDDVQAALDAMEGSSQIRVRAVRGAIAAFAGGSALLLRRHEVTP